MNWPQITIIALWAISLAAALDKHGKPKTGTHSFIHTAIGVAISVAILYCGGFFK